MSNPSVERCNVWNRLSERFERNAVIERLERASVFVGAWHRFY